MEYSEEDLDNIIAGTNFEIGSENALNHEELYNEKSIAELKKFKEQLLNTSGELTEEELDDVKIGFNK